MDMTRLLALLRRGLRRERFACPSDDPALDYSAGIVVHAPSPIRSATLHVAGPLPVAGTLRLLSPAVHAVESRAYTLELSLTLSPDDPCAASLTVPLDAGRRAVGPVLLTVATDLHPEPQVVSLSRNALLVLGQWQHVTLKKQ